MNINEIMDHEVKDAVVTLMGFARSQPGPTSEFKRAADFVTVVGAVTGHPSFLAEVGKVSQAAMVSISNGEGILVLKTPMPWGIVPGLICILDIMNRRCGQNYIATVGALLKTDDSRDDCFRSAFEADLSAAKTIEEEVDIAFDEFMRNFDEFMLEVASQVREHIIAFANELREGVNKAAAA